MHLYIYIRVYTQATPKTWRMRRTSPLLPRLLRRMLASLISSPHSRHPVCVVCVCVCVCAAFSTARNNTTPTSLYHSLCVCMGIRPSIYIYIYMYMCMCVLPGMTQCVLIWRRGVLCVLYVSLPCESVCVVLCIVCSCVREEIVYGRVRAVYVYTYIHTRAHSLSLLRARGSLS